MSEFKVGDHVITRWGEEARSVDLAPGMVQDGEHVIMAIDDDWEAARLDTSDGWWYPLALLEKIDDAPAGIDFRDECAMRVMQAFLSVGDVKYNIFLSDPRGRELTRWIAEDSYAYADAMLEARKK